jgi:GT2 family glycosyltransferase
LDQMRGSAWVYLNSDDLLAPNALKLVRAYFENPEIQWLSGSCEIFDVSGIQGHIDPIPAQRQKDFISPWNRADRYFFPFSGSCFMRRDIVNRIGFFDESFHYSMDIEYYCRAFFVGYFRQTLVPDVLARWRWHPESKTLQRGIAYAFREDEIRIAQRYMQYLPEAEQREIARELKSQELLLSPRKAMYFLKQHKRVASLRVLLQAMWRRPKSVFSRPWLGALRRNLEFWRYVF